MRPGARAAAAIEILMDVEARKRPAAEAIKDWALSHRFAGSKDRAAIGDFVFGALRWKASSAWRMGEDTPRAWVLGAWRWGFLLSPEEIAPLCAEDAHAPKLSDAELRLLQEGSLHGAPAWVEGNYPEWLEASFVRAFGDERIEEGMALAAPAPLDLRANALKTTREKLIAALAESPKLSEAPIATPYAAQGVRIAWSQGRSFPWASEQSFVKGWFEVQDEGSQLAVALSGVQPGMQVADVCAGGGGKTLALAAAMENKGQIYAFDIDGRRLAPMKERLDRAGARNVQIRAPARTRDVLEDLRERMDLVLVDAPCSGSGVWRRAPDSKWRLRPAAIAKRQEEQAEALARGAALVKPGGRLVYVTCSVLPEENGDRVGAFLAENRSFSRASLATEAAGRLEAGGPGSVQFTPLKTGCDGFFVAALTRSA
ncbi:MAG: RsmB/NOP family class I SAM-dependent RNA methyltransferase [Hyphomonadaceae bacterium]|nr:RsmB/NOP family class I SAM-dependent RNA methyltransferase [Hyphomonadaceae bacterium]